MSRDEINKKRAQRTNVLGVGVSSINMEEAVDILLNARAAGESGYVCVTGVHGVIESQRDPELKAIHNRSFLTVPDGMPTVWMGREQGFVNMGRVYGPDLMLAVCEATAGLNSVKYYDLGVKTECSHQEMEGEPADSQQLDLKPKAENLKLKSDDVESNFLYPSQDETGGLDLGDASAAEGKEHLTPNHLKPKTEKMRFTHFLYGSTPEVLEKLKANLEMKFPGLSIVGTYSPPFRPLNEEEEAGLQQLVAACRPDFFWVGLSTPKQEKFMAGHSPASTGFKNYGLSVKRDHSDSASITPDHIKPKTAALARYPLECGIMLGVGAAFDIHAGLLKDAPEWVKNSGLQWFYRLCQEPKRLWRRYLDIVPKFLWLSFLQVLGVKQYSIEE